MKTQNYVAVLGARCGIDCRGILVMSEHMLLRAASALYWWQANPDDKLIICGGPSFHVRYPLRLDKPLLNPPDFSKAAGKKAATLPSESSIIAAWLNNCGVPYENMILEQKSRTTAENAKEAAKIVKDFGGGTVMVLSMIYHLLRPHENATRANAMQAFRKELKKARLRYNNPQPLFTEKILLRNRGEHYLGSIHKFYQQPRSGYLWDADEICRRLRAQQILEDLKPIGKADPTKPNVHYVVRKFVLDLEGKEIRHEDYPEQFGSEEEALPFLAEKQEKYRQTVEDYKDEGSTITEGRRYEIVPIET